MQNHWVQLRVLASALMFCAASTAAPVWGDCPIDSEEFTPDPTATSTFLTGRCKFATTGVNPFFPLLPGYRIVLESDEERQVITVLHKTREVNGVTTRVVEESSFEKDGEELTLIEKSLNYFAICRQTNSVFYFGEDVNNIDEEGNVTHGGTWHAGRHGARPGIIMPGTILVGGRYYEELAPEESALDKAEIVSIEHGCEAGDFEFSRKCVTTENTTDCGDDLEAKVYVAGIGIVVDEDLELTHFGFVDDDDDDGDSDD